MRAKIYCTFLLYTLFSVKASGQSKDTVHNFDISYRTEHRFYTSNGLDFAILSTAFVSKPGQSRQLTAPRFTALVNFGFNFNYDLAKNFGLVSGLGIRNIGFIEKEHDTSIIRRVYSLGIPLGFKLGDLRNRNFFFGGGGIDIPFNYREKAFKKRGNKEKFNEWFSDRTPRIMPFIYAGCSFDPGITLKLQYYPGNFLNPDFEAADSYSNLYKPYNGYQVNLLLFSLGIDIRYNQYRIQQKEYLEMKREREEKGLL